MSSKCANPDCLNDARRVLRLKRGAVKDFHEAAEAELGVTHEQALADEAVRARVLAAARSQAYQEYPALAICGDRECVAYAVAESGIEDTTRLQVVPVRRAAA